MPVLMWRQVTRHTPANCPYVREEKVQGMRVRSKFTVTAEVWPGGVGAQPKWPAKVAFMTGIPEVDAKVANSTNMLDEFPRRIVVTVTRQYEGGVVMSETTTTVVDDIHEVPPVDAKRFVRPTDYREQPPVIGSPGS